MKTRNIWACYGLFSLLFTACGNDTQQPIDEIVPFELVDPFIGTGGHYFGVGSGFAGASLPFGMAKPGPDTTTEHGASDFHHCSGYHADDEYINGFSQVHIHGTGAPEYGALLFMPIVQFGPEMILESNYRSIFSKEYEHGTPGYYSVILDASGTQVELTATEHCAYHRYTYPPEISSGTVIVDLSHAIAGCKVAEAAVFVEPMDSEISGWLIYQGSLTGRSGGVKLYFAARFNQVLDDWTLWSDGQLSVKSIEANGVDVGAAVAVNTQAPVTVQIGLSYVDIAGARNNLSAELFGKDFDTIQEQAKEAWSRALERVMIEGGSEDQKTIFYTALYHAQLTPTIFTDADGRYTGFDLQVHQADGFTYYSDFSMWDTYRTVHSLFMLMAPDRQRDMVISLLKMHEHGGHLPKWPAGTGYTGCMIGTPADVVISESYLKGITNFNVESAFDAIKHNATTAQASGGRAGVARYMELGYVPADEVDGATSRTLEFTVADAAISAFAEALGHSQDAEDFANRSRNYRNVFDSETLFMRGKNVDGSWAEPTAEFDPLDWAADYYTEGTAWQYLWLAPHDPQGLIELFGSPEAFVNKLEAFFSTPEPDDPIWEFLPKLYYWQGNEPDLHTAYFFNAAGRPERTQFWARNILATRYGTGVDGLAGNDDCGTLSAWYIFSSAGFYPIAGLDFYYIGSPLFDRITFDLGNEKVFEITAKDVSEENLYIQSARLNGTTLEVPHFTHTIIKDGGTLELSMGSQPSEWGK
ncbi:MAG: GH92 family glycosyl hydrolase [Deltaproteobacteria bacterium]|nr:GH92 family glycosyl hydrolase [Deltaproteobacteria bacterium]